MKNVNARVSKYIRVLSRYGVCGFNFGFYIKPRKYRKLNIQRAMKRA